MTQAYIRWKNQTQSVFDFAVLISHAVPALKRQISLLEKGVITELPRVDYFPPDVSMPHLRERAANYKEQLASFLTISLFSFFEAYVIDAMKEMFEFHGGVDALQKRAEKKEKLLLAMNDVDIKKAKAVLRGNRNQGHIQRYKKYSKELTDAGYRFPSEMFSSYGVRMLVQKVNSLRAKDIPDLLVNGLHMDISEDTIIKFNEFRELRNRIAHGTQINLSVGEVARRNEILKELALALNKHLHTHFLLFEEFTE